MQSRAARLARGWVTGAFATVVAAVLHISAGGVAPSALALVLGLVFAGLLGTALTGRRPSLPRLAIAVGLSQAAFHLGFSVIGAGGGATTTSSGHHAAFAFTTAAAAPHAAHQDGPLMWMAHVVAGALTIAFLVGAERALWRMLSSAARFVASAFRSPPAVVAVPRPTRFSTVSAVLHDSASALLATTLSRRGPPAFGLS